MVGQHLPQPVSVHDKTPVIKSCWGSSLWLLSSFICTIYLSCDKHLSIAFNWRLMEFVNSSMQHTDAYMKTPRCCGASGHPNAWMCTQEKHVWWIRPSFKPNTKLQFSSDSETWWREDIWISSCSSNWSLNWLFVFYLLTWHHKHWLAEANAGLRTPTSYHQNQKTIKYYLLYVIK